MRVLSFAPLDYTQLDKPDSVDRIEEGAVRWLMTRNCQPNQSECTIRIPKGRNERGR